MEVGGIHDIAARHLLRIPRDDNNADFRPLDADETGKSPAVQFTSDYIPALEHGRIKAALAVALNESDVRAAFITPAHDEAEIASELRRLRMEIEKR